MGLTGDAIAVCVIASDAAWLSFHALKMAWDKLENKQSHRESF